MILSNGDLNHLQIKFKGKIPSKLFSFRQENAEEWLNKMVLLYIRIIASICFLNGVNVALEALVMQCAWHMHKLQPMKYPLNEISRNNLLDIYEKFVNDYSY